MSRLLAVDVGWHSLVALDEAGAPLTPVLTWHDVSAAGAAPVDAFARTGCPPHASYWPAKLARVAAKTPRRSACARNSPSCSGGRRGSSVSATTCSSA